MTTEFFSHSSKHPSTILEPNNLWSSLNSFICVSWSVSCQWAIQDTFQSIRWVSNRCKSIRWPLRQPRHHKIHYSWIVTWSTVISFLVWPSSLVAWWQIWMTLPCCYVRPWMVQSLALTWGLILFWPPYKYNICSYDSYFKQQLLISCVSNRYLIQNPKKMELWW